MTAVQAAVAAGCDYLDTADNYGHVNELIREALNPYPDGLAMVSKQGGGGREAEGRKGDNFGRHGFHLRRGNVGNRLAQNSRPPVARGHSGSPYYWLCAIGGLAYALAIAFFRWRG